MEFFKNFFHQHPNQIFQISFLKNFFQHIQYNVKNIKKIIAPSILFKQLF